MVNPVDIYLLDEELTEEEILVRNAVRDWVRERYLHILEDSYEDERFPIEERSWSHPSG